MRIEKIWDESGDNRVKPTSWPWVQGHFSQRAWDTLGDDRKLSKTERIALAEKRERERASKFLIQTWYAAEPDLDCDHTYELDPDTTHADSPSLEISEWDPKRATEPVHARELSFDTMHNNLFPRDMSGWNFDGSIFFNVQLPSWTVLRNAKFGGVTFSNFTAHTCDFRGAVFSGSRIDGAFRLIGCDLRGANFTGLCMSNARLHESNLNGAIFEQAEIPASMILDGADQFNGAIFNFIYCYFDAAVVSTLQSIPEDTVPEELRRTLQRMKRWAQAGESERLRRDEFFALGRLLAQRPR